MPLGIKLAYSSGNLGKNLQWNTVDLIYLFFLTEVVGLRPATAGLIILISLVWDGISDPLIGREIDRRRPEKNGYQSILLWAAPLSFAAFLLLFTPPAGAAAGAAAWALAVSILFRTAYTLVDVPHNALLADLTRDSRERTSLSAYRFLFSSVGTIIIAFAIAPALGGEGEQAATDYLIYAGLIGAIYLGVMLYSAWFSRMETATGKLETSIEEGIVPGVRALVRNERLVLVFAIAAISTLLIPVFLKLTLFYASSWLTDATEAKSMIIAFAVGQVIALPVWVSLSHRYEKRNTAIGAHLCFAAIAISFLILRPDDTPAAFVHFAIAGFSFSGVNVMIWAIIPDTVEFTQATSGRRYEALTFGLFLMVLKIFGGLSTALTGLALDIAGYQAAEDNLKLPGIIFAMSILPIIGGAVSSMLLMRLNLSHDNHSAISSERLT